MKFKQVNMRACVLATTMSFLSYTSSANEIDKVNEVNEVALEQVTKTSETNITDEVTPTVISDRTNKFKPIVLPFYDPSIKAGINFIPLFAFYPDDDDLISDASTIALPMIYTSNDSYITKVVGDIILFEDNFRVSFETGFTSTNVQLSGIDTNKETISFDTDFMFKVAENLFFGVGGKFDSTRYTAKTPEEQALLGSAGFTEDYQDDIGYRLSMQWDTREHYYYPHGGFIWDLKYENHSELLGNDADQTYSSIFTDFRHFYSLDTDNNHIVATKFVARYLMDAENAPSSAFSTYGRQGKEVQRGYAFGDYISSNMVNLEVEYRHRFANTNSAFLNKTSVVAIGGVGKSFGEQLTGNSQDFRDSDVLGVIGVGFRYNILPYERLNLKFDLTYNSDGEVIAYFGFGESI